MKHKKLQRIAIFLLVVFIQQIIFPTVALALTSGPSQPEVQSFEPFSTSEMVNLSSGDMTYNIPLIDVDGYPVNISYSSGITMDQEASWVGLGWNINPGVINRNMRGIPDDFNGDVVTKESHIKANNTYGVTFPVSGELLGLELASLGLSLGISFNNYKGVGLDMSFSVALDGGKNNKGPLNASMGVSLGSESGLGVNPQLSFSKNIKTEEDKAIGVGGKLGMSYNSRGGLSALSFSGSAGPMALDKSKATKDGKTPEQASEAKNDVQVDADGNGGAASAGPTYSASGPAFNGGSSISLAGQTYTPSISMPMLNLSVSASFTGGFEVFGLHPNIRLNGYYSGQYLMGGSRSLPAYGYINSQNGQNLDEVMLDFNREKDGGYTDNTPSLPLTNFTYDIYSVSGQGIGGMYRAFRGDLGYVFDSEVNSYSMNIPLPGIELGVGVAAGRFGCNLSLNGSNSKSGKWKDDNLAAPALKFRSDKHNGNNLYEAAFFKQAGEKLAETDPDFFDKMGGFDPTRIELLGSYSNLPALSAVRNEVKGTVTPITSENYRKNRARRNEMIAPLSGDASSKIGVSKYIESFGDVAAIGASAAFATQPTKTSIFSPTESIARNQYPRKGHHISEITSTRSDGTRYIYGVPAYNLFQKDVTFAVSGRTADETNGLVRYNPGIDNSADNNNGTDNFFERISNPPYAHSYLLTAVLGANYVDLTDDGPTLDDLGGYTKINYSKVSGDGFAWRTPFEENMASHNEGMKSQTIMDEYNDDKGSYIYGKKEVWQMHSIETKNKVAIFYTSYRDDGLGVKGENGGKDVNLNSSKLRKLDKIEVYAREDLTKNGLAGATPVKTVHFVYDHSLCTNIPNHVSPSATNGKLTLKKIYFTYGKSQKSMLSPYEFQYGEMKDVSFAINPKYNMKGNDRWGNYKQTKGDVFTNCNLPATLPLNSDYPYTDQDRFNNGSCALNGFYKADVYAHAWNLTKIIMPSGGEVKIEYEADDYAYVQDRRAMQMMKVVGAFNNISGGDPYTDGDRNKLYSGGIIGGSNREWLVFDITELEPTLPSADLVKKKYFMDFEGKPMNYLYFKFFVDLKDGKYEWVPGYLKYEFNTIGSFSANNKRFVKVRILPTSGLAPHNSIAFTAWNYMRLNLPRLAYNQPDRNMNGFMQILKALQSMGEALVQTATGFANFMRLAGAAREFNTDKSFIRLYTPNNKKKGGGARVKKIISNDKWATLTNNTTSDFDFDYGQEYNYTTKNEYGDEISSGVASYEPSFGNDENPFKQPVFYSEEKLLAPDDDFYQEEPYGESFFPSPGITYSKVSVSSLKRNNVTTNATGKMVHEFYTTKDFPTITKKTSISPVRIKPNPIARILNFIVEDYMAVSQGYVIELNDMNAKPKAQWVYAEKQLTGGGVGEENPISGVEYKYKQSTSKRVDNNFLVINNKGEVSQKMVGVEADQIVDFREQKTVSRSGGFGGNLDAFLAVIFPVAIPVVLPSYSSEEVRFRSAVITKVINRYALMEETISYTDGAKSSVKNIAIDEETGEVLLTESTNVFGDKLYNFTYPAHWAYDNMGQAYKNIGYHLVKQGNNAVQLNDANLVQGDELLVDVSGAGVIKGWVGVIGPGLKVISDIAGNKIEESKIKSLVVTRSGRKNQPATAIGSVTTLSNPLVWSSAQNATLNLTENILNASAIEYSDDWKIFCECELALNPGETKKYNKLLRKRGGSWRPKTNWAYLTGRKQTLVNNNTNIRVDGTYENYNPFWILQSGAVAWIPTTNQEQWQYKSTGTIYSPYGMELESVDPLGRYSAASYGYGNVLPTAVSGNAMYKEIGFDGFEDYNYQRCIDEHFGFRKPLSETTSGLVELTASKSHSGYRSMRVKPTGTIRLTKQLTNTCN